MRIPFQAEVVVRAGGLTVRSGGEIDVSMNGLRMSVAGALPPEHASCEAQILLGSVDRIVITASGTVVRSGPGTLAIHFTEIDPESYQHLSRLILLNADEPEKAEREFREHAGIRPRRP